MLITPKTLLCSAFAATPLRSAFAATPIRSALSATPFRSAFALMRDDVRGWFAEQGYAPSLQSMFNYPTLKPTNLVRSSLLFVPESSQLSTNQLPDPSVVVLPSQPATYPYSQNTTRSTSDVYFDSASSLSRCCVDPSASSVSATSVVAAALRNVPNRPITYMYSMALYTMID
ncbi:hypothetical protein C8R48DRAFT_780338 [Suillus tomentosus]|nr:hypothetical protein C8R48DRAFT_780338 [Suillus tomentosus]